MPGDASDRAPALGLFWCVVLCGAAALATFPPNDMSPVATTVYGLPRLALYALAGVVLAATGTRAAAAAIADWRTGPVAGWSALANKWLVTWLLLAAAAASVNALRLHGDIGASFGPALWIASIACVAVAVTPVWRAGALRRWRPRRPTALETAVGLLLVGAAVVRFVDLGGVPPNVQADEGDRAGSALDVLDGTAPASWFDSGWFYVSMVYFRALAAIFDVFGTGVVQGRALNAAAGVVLVGAVAWIGFRHFGRRVGLVATALAAASPFALQFSRTIAESGVGAALFAVSLAGFLEGGRSGRPWPFAVAGLSGGLSLYTYASARAWPLAAAAAIVVLLALARERRAAVLRGAAVAVVAAAVAALPYAVHLSQHPDEATLRFEQTTVLEPVNRTRLTYIDEDTPLPKLLVLQLERSFGLFDRYPDASDFLPTGKPVLPAFLAALTLLGVFLALARSPRDPRLALLSIWFWIGLSGMVLTVETPAGQRAAALVVTLPLLAAVALSELASRLPSFVRYLGSRHGAPATGTPSPGRAPRLVADAAVGVAVAVIVAVQLSAYFVDYRGRTAPWAGPTTEGREVARLGRAGPVYAVEREHHRLGSGWVRFLAREARTGAVAYAGRQLPLLASDERPPPQPDPRRAVPLPGPAETMTVLLFSSEHGPYLDFLRDLYPGGIAEPTAEGRVAFRVPPGTPGRTTGARVLRGGQPAATVPTFGDLPQGTRLPAELVWSAGIRVAQTGQHGFAFTAPPGASLAIDRNVVAVAPRHGEVRGVLDVTSGLHLVEIRARVAKPQDGVALRWSRRLGTRVDGRPLTPFRRSQLYARMAVPRGLTARVVASGAARSGVPPTQTWLDTALAADFTGISDQLPLEGSMSWRGALVVPRQGIYRMAFLTDAPIRVVLDGRALPLARVREHGVALDAGKHPIHVTLAIANQKPSHVRWMWIPPGRGSASETASGWSVVPSSLLRPHAPVRLGGDLSRP